MTKEKLIAELTDVAREVSVFRIEGILQRFLESNVILTKRDTRIDNADFWHEVIEHSGKYQWLNGNGVFMTDSIYTNPLSKNGTYQLVSEPVYEYQYMYKNILTNQYDITGYFSDEENSVNTKSWIKLEETKRIRQ